MHCQLYPTHTHTYLYLHTNIYVRRPDEISLMSVIQKELSICPYRPLCSRHFVNKYKSSTLIFRVMAKLKTPNM